MAESLYLHVPFCKSICYYCDFKRGLYNEKKADEWLRQIQQEWHLKQINHQLKTIYIGGGTPTALHEKQLKKLLELTLPYQEQCIEFTIESNIESLNEEKLMLLKKHGVNRISLGVQSLQDDLLKMMNRKHTKKDVFDCIDNIYAAGITSISVDMMYGFENQSLDSWSRDLMELTKCEKIKHLSLYSLTIEENSVFGRRKIKTCENEVEALMYEKAIEILEQQGFEQYEVANFCRKGFASLHNCNYWKYEDFYGIGIGASGKEEGVRYTNTGSLEAYLQDKHEIEREILTTNDRIFENIMMSLRMRTGLDLNVFRERYHQDIFEIYEKEIEEERKKGNLMIQNDSLIATKKGMFYLHDVLVRFLR